MKHKLGLVSVSFRDHSPQQILEAMEDCGLAYIEWGSDIHAPVERAEQIAALQRQYGITCCSYGTYFRLGTTPIAELEGYIRAAKCLGTTILRLWCGIKNSGDYTPQEKETLFVQCRAAARMAEEAQVTLCMECHNNTFTDRKEAALELMQAVASPHFRMYWQPSQLRTEQENLAYARLLAPYTLHLHVFNWKGKEKYPLLDAGETWREYLACFEGTHTLLLEFMPDGRLETLKQEAAALKEIAE